MSGYRIDKTVQVECDGIEYSIKLVEGWNEYVHLVVAKVLLDHIIKNNGDPISYNALCRLVNNTDPSLNLEPHFIDRFFDKVSYSCIESGLPPISAIVVNKESKLPGEGFIRSYYPHLKKNEMAGLKKCIDLIEEVKAFNHWSIMMEAMWLA